MPPDNGRVLARPAAVGLTVCAAFSESLASSKDSNPYQQPPKSHVSTNPVSVLLGQLSLYLVQSRGDAYLPCHPTSLIRPSPLNVTYYVAQAIPAIQTATVLDCQIESNVVGT